jgi:hypothetical protein
MKYINCHLRNSKLVALACGLLILMACKKEKVVQDSTMSFKVNGVEFNFTSKTDLTFRFGGMIIQTSGQEVPTPYLYIYSPKLDIIVQDTTAIKPGVYEGIEMYSSGFTREVSLTYKASSDSVYYSPFSAQQRVSFTEIQRIDREGLKGKFSGVVIHPNGYTLEISDGEFYIYTYGSP